MALDKVFKSTNQFKLALKESKFALFLESVAFLGYIVSAYEVNVQEGKIQAVKE